MSEQTEAAPRKRIIWLAVMGILLIILVAAGWLLFPTVITRLNRLPMLWEWFRNGEMHSDWLVHAGERCGDASFIIPTDGYIGFLWGDSFRPMHRHQGLDIFGGEDVGKTPVVAAYSGYLTRQADWKSTVIVRVPEDPLYPGRQIWLYYTHMADAQGTSFISDAFPPGTTDLFVEAGTLLGYQGNFSGDSNSPTGVHLHFSIVRDDGQGGYLNELKITNTIDPSPYLGMQLYAAKNPSGLAVCQPAVGR